MVDLNIGRTTGQIGEYLKYDLGHGLGGVAAFLIGGAVAGVERNQKSQTAGVVALAAAVIMFAAAGTTGGAMSDLLATGSLGGLFAAITWFVGLDNLREGASNALGGGNSQSARTRRSPQRTRVASR